MANNGQGQAWIEKVIFGISLPGLLRVLFALACLFLLVFIALLFYEPKRSFLLEAETRSIELTFLPGANTWRFPNVVVCRPLPAPSRIPDPDCGLASEAVQSDGGEWITAWDTDMRIRLTAKASGQIQLEVLSSTRDDLPNGSTAWIDPPDTASIGALTFAAAAVLGREMTTGSQSYLISGRWEAREESVVVSAFRSLTEIVKSGTLSLGTQVEILNDGVAAKSYGHVVPMVGPDSSLIFRVNILSEPGDTALSIRHFGLDGPVIIEPDWMDVILSSPLILSIGVLLAMLAAVSQILSDAPRFSGASSKSERTDGEGPQEATNDHNPNKDIK